MEPPHPPAPPRLILATVALLGSVPAVARGDEPTRSDSDPRKVEPANPPRAIAAARPSPLRVGAIAGVGFPRPFAVEALVSWRNLVDVGAEYGFMPTVSLGGVDTDLWSLAGDIRIRPFRGAFFVGALVGRQHVGASTVISAAGLGSAREQLGLDSWFVNPRIGFLWTTHFGLAWGIDAGLQIPIGASVSSSLPLWLYPSGQARAQALGGMLLPTIDLLRIGFVM